MYHFTGLLFGASFLEPCERLIYRVDVSIIFTDTVKGSLLALGRIVYFCLFHPLASFPGPLLAKGGDVSMIQHSLKFDLSMAHLHH